MVIVVSLAFYEYQVARKLIFSKTVIVTSIEAHFPLPTPVEEVHLTILRQDTGPDLVSRDRFEPGETLLAIHTGGVFPPSWIPLRASPSIS